MIDITPHKLRQAADIKERIDALQRQLDEILGSEVATTPVGTSTEGPKRRKFSAAARARMREAQKARWAKVRGTTPEAEPIRGAKRKMSVAGRARIAAAAKARWAAFRATKGKAQPAARARSKFSPAAKARLSALAKARWAKAKAQGQARL